MENTVKLTYNGVTVEHQLGAKALRNPAFYANRLNAIKRAFAEEFAVQQMLDAGKITADNLVVNEVGNVVKHIATNTITAALLAEQDALIDSIVQKIVVETN